MPSRASRRFPIPGLVAIPSESERVIGNVERPRPVAIVIVAKNTSVAGANQLPTLQIELPRREIIDAPTPEAGDAGSNLFRSLPALVGQRSTDPSQSLAIVAAIANSVVLALLLLRLTRLRKTPRL